MGPGALVHIGNKTTSDVHIKVMDYDHVELKELTLKDLADCSNFSISPTVSWIDIDGIHDAHLIEVLGNKFGIHTLVLEDIMNSTSRPKVEFFEDYMFVTLKMLELDAQSKNLNVEQLSLIVGDKFLLMFQERPGDSFNPIRDRIRTSKGKVRSKDAYYLAYLILDTVVDNYIGVSEQLAKRIDVMEQDVLKKSTEATLHQILALRKELLDFKRSIDPLKEAINTITRELDDEIAKYYRDLYDHVIYESENLAVYREMLVNLIELYHSSLGMKMNQVIKVLTIITTIFVPLTFIVGVYGMNFDFMPELRWRYGYPTIIAGMLVLVIGMLIYFRKKKWL
jgi:magnesium transporter